MSYQEAILYVLLSAILIVLVQIKVVGEYIWGLLDQEEEIEVDHPDYEIEFTPEED